MTGSSSPIVRREYLVWGDGDLADAENRGEARTV